MNPFIFREFNSMFMSKMSQEFLIVWEVWFSLLFQRKLYILSWFLLFTYFGIIYIWTVYQSLDKMVYFIIISLPLKESLTLFQIWVFFVKLSLILSQLELLREEKLIQVFWWKILTLSFVLANQFYFHMPKSIGRGFLKCLSLS